jgi:dTDP-glucose pyrophosphorylase
MQRFTGVILAAGKGTRMHPFSSSYPKPILPIGNIPLLGHQLYSMKELGITDVIIVIGYLGYEIVRTIGDGEKYGVSVTYIEQKETLGIAHALGTLEKYINNPFILFLGDIFFNTKDFGRLTRLYDAEKTNAILASKIEKDPEAIKRNFAIFVDKETDLVKRVVEKPRYLHVNDKLKGCGLYLFDQHIFDAIRRTPRTAMRDEYEITDAIQILIQDGLPVKNLTIIENDLNLTFPEDLLDVNLFILDLWKKDIIIGENVKMSKGCKVKKSVIGNNVIIKNDIEISECVILDNSVVDFDKNCNRIIITPTNVISCAHI